VAGGAAIAGPGVAADFLDTLQAQRRDGLNDSGLGDLKAMTDHAK
jgi:hypothetical protein